MERGLEIVCSDMYTISPRTLRSNCGTRQKLLFVDNVFIQGEIIDLVEFGLDALAFEAHMPIICAWLQNGVWYYVVKG